LSEVGALAKESEEVKNWLGRYRELSQDADHIEQRIESLRSRLENPGAANLSDTPKAPGFEGDRLGQQLAVIGDLEEELKAVLTERWGIYEETEAAIRQITGRGAADKKALLRSRYIDLTPWPDIAFQFYGDRADYSDREDTYIRNCHRLHGAAINALTEVLRQSGQLPREGGREK